MPESSFLEKMVQTHFQTRSSAPFVSGSSRGLPAEWCIFRQQSESLHPFVPSLSHRLPVKQASHSHRALCARPAIDSAPMRCYDPPSDAEGTLSFVPEFSPSVKLREHHIGALSTGGVTLMKLNAILFSGHFHLWLFRTLSFVAYILICNI